MKRISRAPAKAPLPSPESKVQQQVPVRLVPDSTTLEAMKRLEAGNLKRQVDQVERLFTRRWLTTAAR
jgi:hypothetical protein